MAASDMDYMEAKPSKMSLTSQPWNKASGQKSGGESCEIWNLVVSVQSKSVNNVHKLLQLPGDFVPKTTTRPVWTPLGDFRSQPPWAIAPNENFRRSHWIRVWWDTVTFCINVSIIKAGNISLHVISPALVLLPISWWAQSVTCLDYFPLRWGSEGSFQNFLFST